MNITKKVKEDQDDEGSSNEENENAENNSEGEEEPEAEDDGITFVGDSESQFFNYLKDNSSRLENEETVATSIVDSMATGKASTYYS